MPTSLTAWKPVRRYGHRDLLSVSPVQRHRQILGPALNFVAVWSVRSWSVQPDWMGAVIRADSVKTKKAGLIQHP